MNLEMQSPEPSGRDRRILEDVIRTFIHTGSPVSSRSLARMAEQRLSSASIRNVMADLEDCGYLSQPHTSAGRVPTAAGYHYYIDTLMQSRVLSSEQRRYIRGNIEQVVTDVEDLMGMVTHLLTELSQQIGIVLAPMISETIVKAVHFLNLSGRRALCVLESEGGLVEHRVVQTLQSITSEELVEISNYLTDHFSGLTLRDIRDRLLSMMADDREQINKLLTNAISLAQQALGTVDEPDLLFEGTETVLTQPELSDIDRVRRLLETFTDKAELVRVLDQLIGGPGTHVIIGEDSELTSDLDFSLVATTYGSTDRVLGTLGIFGPSRMEYDKVVPLVDFLGKTVSDTLVEGTERDS
jgi:heat-inducible transcriptional repressor